MPEDNNESTLPAAGVILVAYEKLFGGGRGVLRFARNGLRYVELDGGHLLVEQNPKKRSAWAKLARDGRRVAWVLRRDGEYIARIVDGEVTMLD
jgi:ribosomal protein L24E